MKRRFKTIAAGFAASVICLTAFAGCFGGNETGGTPKEYTLQYTDDSGTHQITVTGGEAYVMENVPQKTGYKFLGLFDAAEGGKQYVSAQGSSLSVFEDGKNLVLFPQWKAEQYDLVLDFAGAEVTASRQYTVEYDCSLPQLPLDLRLEHSEFCGWYTQENCGGTQVADKYGLIPTVSVVNGDNFNLFDGNARINLYAGFKTATYTVTLNFGSGMDAEKVKVPYDTAVKDVVYNTRNAQGEAVLSWSKQEGGAPFTGAIVQDTTLYATDWATTIEFDTDGGERLAPLVARAGAQIALPTPVRELYSFVGWEQTNGTAAEFAVMPQSNTTLKAVWKPKIVFDANGGKQINDYNSPSGAAITLPTPQRDGYVFAGWYTPDKQLYTTKKMPSVGTLLKAGWYKQKTKIKTFLDKSSYSNVVYWKTPEIKYTLNFTEEAPEVDWDNTVYVSIDFHADFKHVMAKVRYSDDTVIYENSSSTDIYATKEHFYFYNQAQMSDAYYMDKVLVDHGNGQINTTYTTTDFSTSLEVKGGTAYMALAADKYLKNKANETIYIEYYVTGWRMTNFWAEIHYPDTSVLYL